MLLMAVIQQTKLRIKQDWLMASVTGMIAGFKLRKAICSLALMVILFPGFTGSARSEPLVGDTVILRALDKITARIEDLTIPIDTVVKYGRLRIKPRKCLKRPPEETPETSVFLEIEEQKIGEETSVIFMGWMFASSPSLNALEHPVYDVWVIDCKISEPVRDGDSN